MSQSDPPLAPDELLAPTLVADAVARALTERGVQAQREAGAAVRFGPVAAPALLPGRLFSGEALLAVAGGEVRFQACDGGVVPRLDLRRRLQFRLGQLFWPVVISVPLALTGSYVSAAVIAVLVFLALGVVESLLLVIRTPRYLRRLVATETDLIAFRQAHGLPTPGRAV